MLDTDVSSSELRGLEVLDASADALYEMTRVVATESQDGMV